MTEPGLNGNHGRDTMTMMGGWFWMIDAGWVVGFVVLMLILKLG